MHLSAAASINRMYVPSTDAWALCIPYPKF